MQISPELEKRICRLRYAVNDAYDEYGYKSIPAPCRYFKALTGRDKAIGASCARCRAERMVVLDDHNVKVDCYTLMILDFLKEMGVEVDR